MKVTQKEKTERKNREKQRETRLGAMVFRVAVNLSLGIENVRLQLRVIRLATCLSAQLFRKPLHGFADSMCE